MIAKLEGVALIFSGDSETRKLCLQAVATLTAQGMTIAAQDKTIAELEKRYADSQDSLGKLKDEGGKRCREAADERDAAFKTIATLREAVELALDGAQPVFRVRIDAPWRSPKERRNDS